MMFDPSYNPISARYRFARLPYAHMGGEAAEREVDFLEFVWQQHAVRTVRDVLDVGCGTGRHSIELARRGYWVTGVDLSQAMLDVLQEQMPAGLDITLRRLDMRELDYDQAFDALICMNSTLAYMLTDEDIARALSAFQRALRPDAILFIDVMNYLSLLGRCRPTDFEEYREVDLAIFVAIRHSLDNLHGIWHHDELLVVRDGDETHVSRERHDLRMLTYNALCHFLYEAGFEDIVCYGSYNAREPAEEDAPRLLMVARRA